MLNWVPHGARNFSQHHLVATPENFYRFGAEAEVFGQADGLAVARLKNSGLGHLSSLEQ
jgi:hypothetical protein